MGHQILCWHLESNEIEIGGEGIPPYLPPYISNNKVS